MDIKNNKASASIGCHLSSSKGFLAMGKTALEIGADTFQFFTRNPRGSKAKEINPTDAAALCALLDEHHFGKIVAHAPYTLNPCSSKPEVREFALQTMADDLKRMEFVPYQYYNFHPGSHTGQGVDFGIEQIAALLNEIIKPEQTTTILLETMSGKGTEIGAIFDELASIISKIACKDKIGVCLDTCHVFDGGYDIVGNLDGVLEEFDNIIGLEKLCAIHLNDTKNTLGSHRDRHECIGKGCIGSDTLSKIYHHPSLAQLPFILETPNDLAGYAAEIAFLKSSLH